MRTRLSALAILLAVASPALAQQDAASCAALRDTVLSAAHVRTVRVVETEGLPAYCEVRATALPAINIEVRLPLEGWNGKYYQAGCGGFCGILGRADASGAAGSMPCVPGWSAAMPPPPRTAGTTGCPSSMRAGHTTIPTRNATGVGGPSERPTAWRRH
ncbi:hypothetical protein KU6B_02870 [Mameliella alba]|uniref:hypothetical protein n=1 Tax=Mameliella alba TaxID=561184 RepID=UPI0013E45DBB|nr:hypothetical protein KU6B_02870 [Mameliella alba]